MKLDLDNQTYGRSSLELEGCLTPELGEMYPDPVKITGSLDVQDLDSRLNLLGKLQASGTTACGRCLVDFECTWEVPVELVILRQADEVDPEDVGVVIVQRHGVVDLTPAIQELAVLAYPQSPTCRDSCRGLCVSCGADLNQKECGCTRKEIDPRWQGLP